MRGVILAGGKGTRMWPLTAVTNKHLAPVGRLPMIEYPLYTLKKMGIRSVNVVTGGEHFEDIAKYLEETHREISFSYHYQKEAGGIAQALSLVEDFAKGEKLAVILGDNIFEGDFSRAAREFEGSDLGAMLFLKKVPDPKRFGVAEIDESEGKIISLKEKPKKPKSNLVVTGLYFYDGSVFDRIKKLKPSGRGEYEITDVNCSYLDENRVGFYELNGFWSDAGTHESRERCCEFVKKGLESDVLSMFSKEVLYSLPVDVRQQLNL